MANEGALKEPLTLYMYVHATFMHTQCRNAKRPFTNCICSSVYAIYQSTAPKHTCSQSYGTQNYLLSQHSLQCLDKRQPEDGRRVGVEADLKDVAVSVVGPELGHEACDHVVLVRERGNASLKARRLMEEQVLRRKQ